MNANRIINMVIAIIMRKVINKGINAGMQRFSGGGKKPRRPQQNAQRGQQYLDDPYEPDPQIARPDVQNSRKQAARASRAAAKMNRL